MTREYCQKCPWFNATMGYLGPEDSRWTADDRCVCKDCKLRSQCEELGPKNIVTCLILTEERFRKYLSN